MHHNFNKNYIHHQNPNITDVLKEVVFGMEDGMVSTLGSITGIAIASQNHATVVLAGVVIIAVESVSMGIGSYLSNRSQEEYEKRKLREEKEEIHLFPREEKEELLEMYIQEGWPKEIAIQMTDHASLDQKLLLKEMALHELKVFPNSRSVSVKGAIYMFFSYIIGGLVPLASYLILPIKTAFPISIILTLAGLFALGTATTKFTKQSPVKMGFRMLVIGGIALAVGLLAGTFVGV